MTYVWESAEQSHRGNCRQSNEDSVLSRPQVGLWAVADGMGGHEAGDVASQAITDALAGVRVNGSLADAVDQIEDVLLSVNDELRLHARSCCQGGTVGSTVVALVAGDGVAVALWAGDSRLYRLRQGRLEQITRDHNPLEDLLESGLITETDAEAADTNVITRAIGGQSNLTLDVAVFDVAPADTLLLCSDGLYRELDDETLVSVLEGCELHEAVEELMRRALSGEARDNVSLVVARPRLQ